MKTDIVCTISSAAGVSAIGVVRLTGANSLDLVDKFFITPSNKKLSDFNARYMAYGHIVDSNKKVIDEVMVVYYNKNSSYTREQMVEIFAHGNYLALLEIQSLLLSAGANLAEAGEFTKRAFLNGRIDLSQAEAVMDLISSKTKLGFDNAQQQLSGSLNKNLVKIGDKLTDLLAQIEVVIDYPDEDVEIITIEKIKSELNNIVNKLTKLEFSYNTGKIIKNGLKLVISGRPNVGKSSLMNALLGEERAIVTNIAGTTRDVIDADMSINGIAIKLIDTAGIRDSEDKIEQIGVEKSKLNFNTADLVLLVLDAEVGLIEEDIDILKRANAKYSIVVVNKSDIKSELDSTEINKIKEILPESDIIYTAAINDIGINNLKNKISSLVYISNFNESEIITNERHYQALIKANSALKNAISAIDNAIPLDLIEVDLIDGYNYIGEITGQSLDEDVINRIFEKFCLGK